MPGPKASLDYQGFSTAVASAVPETNTSNDYFHVDTNSNQFGAQVGQSLEGLGNQLQQTTQKFVDVYNDSSARDGVTDASKQLSDAEAEYKKNKGNNAVDAYKTFQDRASSIQENMAASMPTIGAQKMFKDQFSREVNGAIFRSGSYMADQVESAQKESINASIANNVNQFSVNATNPTRSIYLGNIQNQALQYAHTLGLPPEAADKLVSQNVGDAYYNAIKVQIQQNPNAAKALYDEGMNGNFSVQRPDADGKMQNIQVPYLDDHHRSAIASEMGSEFRRQESESFQTARAWASSGENYDKEALTDSMKNAGRSEDYIHAQIKHLDTVQDQFGAVDARYNLDKQMQNDTALAYAGKPVQGNYDPIEIAKAYPKEPDKVKEILDQAHDLHQVASFVSGLSTRNPSQVQQELDKFKPNTGSFDPMTFTMLHEGGFVTNDSGKGATNFGVNKESNPDVDVEHLTPDSAKQVLKSRYFDAIGADKMSPSMAMVSGDTAVNMGVGKAKDLISQADGDPNTLIQLRRQEYNRLATQNPEKYGQYLDGWNKRLDDLQKAVDNPTAQGGSDFSDQSRVYTKMVKATHDYYQRLSDDPAGTTMGDDPIMTNLYNNAAKDGTQWNKFVDATWSRQAAVGVPEQLRSALPTQAATTIVSNITQNPQGAPDMLSTLQKQSGPDTWPKIYHSLVAQGGLPPEYQMVTALNSTLDGKKDAYLLSQWMGDETKGKTAADLLGGPKAETDIKSAINSDTAIQRLKTSLIQSGQPKDQVEGTMNAIYSLAYAKSYYNRDPQAAINAAKSITSQYDFMDRGQARIPAQNSQAINLGAQQALDNIEKIATPASIYSDQLHGTVTKPENYYSWVKNAPTWVTSPGEDAIWLKDGEDRWVRDKKGQIVSVPFNYTTPQTPALSKGGIDPLSAL